MELCLCQVGALILGGVSLGWIELVGFGVGLLLGSFLNVCIARVPRGESVVRPGSHCRRCGHAVRWFDNVPVLSWVWLGGRCRDCGDRFSWRYPAVELAVGVWFGLVILLCFLRSLEGVHVEMTGTWWASLFVLGMSRAVLGWMLIGLIVIDWQTLRLPDAFTLSGIAAGLFLVCVQAIFLGPTDDQVVLNTTHQLRMSSPGSFAAHGNVFLTGPEALIFGRVLAVCGAALILLVVRWVYKAVRKRDGMGLGDAKLLAMIAAFLGFWPAVVALFVGVGLASVWAVWLLARGRAGSMTKLAFGSFLGVGGLVAALFGEALVGWYRGLL